MKKILTLAALSTALFAAPAMAQLYVGAGVGQTRGHSNESSWKVYGGLQMTPVLGVEVGYLSFRDQQAVTSDFDAWSVAATGTMPLNANWSVIGKVGGARIHGGGGGENNLLLGIGLGLAINKNWGMRLEYEDMGQVEAFAPGNDFRQRNLGLSARLSF